MMKSYKNITDSKIDWLGEVPNEWKVVKLKYALADVPYPIVDGPFGTQLKADEYTDSGVPLVRISNLDFKGNLTLEDIKFISEQKALEIQRSRIKLNDIIIGKTGATIGKSGLNDKIEYGIVSSSCLKISVDENKLLPLFFRYYVTSANFQNIILQTASGSTRDTINITPMANIEVVIPTLEEQIKIVQYLDHQTTIIDQLIQQKEKLIELLKEKRQAVINEAVTKGLNPNARMKESRIEWLGEVPNDWKVTKLKFLAKLNPSKSEIEKKIDGEDFVSFLPMEKVEENWSYDKNSSAKFSTVSSGLTYFKEGDIIMAKITPCFENGKAAILENLINGFGFGSTEFHTIRPLKVDKRYLFYVTRSDYFMSNGESFMTGSAGQKRVPTSFVSDFYVPVPKPKEQIEIAGFIENYISKNNKISNELELQILKLKEYRQSIISEAVTGKIDVRDWQMN